LTLSEALLALFGAPGEHFWALEKLATTKLTAKRQFWQPNLVLRGLVWSKAH